MPRPKRIVGDAREGIFRRKGSQDELNEFRNEYTRLRNENKGTGKSNRSSSIGSIAKIFAEAMKPKLGNTTVYSDKGNAAKVTKSKERYQDQPGERPMATERINYSGGETTSASKRPTRILADSTAQKGEFQGGEFKAPSKREKRIVSNTGNSETKLEFQGGEFTEPSKRPTRVVGAAKGKKVEFQGGEFIEPSKKQTRVVGEGKGIPQTAPKQNTRQVLTQGFDSVKLGGKMGGKKTTYDGDSYYSKPKTSSGKQTVVRSTDKRTEEQKNSSFGAYVRSKKKGN